MWTLRLLGGLFLERAGADASNDKKPFITRFRTRNTGALLAYLALHPGLHSREMLATLIWPDLTFKKAADNLRVSLCSLRGQLEPMGAAPQSVLTASRFHIGLNAEAVSCDAVAFQSLCEKAHYRKVRLQPEAERIEILQSAFELYGGRLLAGHYEEWIHAQALFLESLFERVAEELIAHHRQTGNFEAALSVASQAASRVTESQEFAALVAVLKSEAHSNSQKQNLARDSSVDAGAAFPHGGSTPVALESIRSAPREPSFLPLYATQVWGREDEISVLQRTVESGKPQRLLTIIGPGGMGKTRLAVHVAGECLKARTVEKVYFVSFAAIDSASRLADVLRPIIGLRAAPGIEPMDQIVEALRLQCSQAQSGSVLLVLDNMEHLLPDAALWAQTLRLRAPELLMWTTSRAPLKLPGEEFLTLGGLDFPVREDGLDAISASPSVGLFVQRARSSRPDFSLTAANAEAIVGLCGRLEGWPLALELAAARAYAFTPSQMLAQLAQSNRLLTRSARRNDPAAARQSSLQTTIEWSYQLLSPQSAQLFLNLSVFADGATAETGGAVDGQEKTLALLSELVAHSLVTCHEKAGVLRYDLLKGMRRFARERLNEAQWKELRRRHAQVFADKLAREAVWMGNDSLQWLEQLDAEHSNFHALLQWADEHDPELLLQCAGQLWRYWESRGLSDEGRAWLQKALWETPPEDESGIRSTPDAAQSIVAWNALSRLCFADGDFAASLQAANSAMALAEVEKNRLGEAHAHFNQGRVWLYRGEIEKSVVAFQQSLQEYDGDASGTAQASIYLGMTGIFRGEYEKALHYYGSAVEIARAAGDFDTLMSALFYYGCIIGPTSGLHSLATPYFQETLTIAQRSGNSVMVCYAQWGLCRVALGNFQLDLAQTHLTAIQQYSRRASIMWGQVYVLEASAMMMAAREEWRQVALLLGASEGARQRLSLAFTSGYCSAFNRVFAPLWDNLPPEELRSLWRRGRRHSLSQAMDAAEGKHIPDAQLLPMESTPPPPTDAPLQAFPMDIERAQPFIAQAHLDAGRLVLCLNETEAARVHFQTALEFFHTIGDAKGKQTARRWLNKTTPSD